MSRTDLVDQVDLVFFVRRLFRAKYPRGSTIRSAVLRSILPSLPVALAMVGAWRISMILMRVFIGGLPPPAGITPSARDSHPAPPETDHHRVPSEDDPSSPPKGMPSLGSGMGLGICTHLAWCIVQGTFPRLHQMVRVGNFAIPASGSQNQRSTSELYPVF